MPAADVDRRRSAREQHRARASGPRNGGVGGEAVKIYRVEVRLAWQLFAIPDRDWRRFGSLFVGFANAL